MRASRALVAGAALAILTVTPGLLADESGEAAVSVSAVSEDGDGRHFAEDSGGLQDGVALESFRWTLNDDVKVFTIDASYSTGQSGWVDLRFDSSKWSAGLRAVNHSTWSDTSFAGQDLPSGTGVASLFPGTVDLDSSFGVSEPQAERLWVVAHVTRRFSGANYARLILRVQNHDGERVPSFGGYSFSDVGTLSAYTAGLERFDSDSTEIKLETAFGWQALRFRLEAATASRTDKRSIKTPLWSTDELLGFNAWNEQADVDTNWLSGGVSWKSRSLSVFGSLVWADVSSTPRAYDRELDAAGALSGQGLQVRSGSVDLDRLAGAVGVSWRPDPRLAVTVSADLRDDDRSGDVSLDLSDSPFTTAITGHDDSRVGFSARVRARLGGGDLLGSLRHEDDEIDIREERDTLLQVNRRDRALDVAKLRYSLRWDHSRFAIWGRLSREDTDVDVAELFEGYVLGNRTRDENEIGASYSFRGSSMKASLDAVVSNIDVDSDLPAFDPIFDPSQTLLPISGEENRRRLTGTLLWFGERGELWAELGVLSLEFDYPDTGVQSGFVPLSEKVTGSVVAVGGRMSAWKGGAISGSFERIDDGSDLDKTLVRASLEASHRLRERLTLFARWSLWDFTNTHAAFDEYTYQLITAGARVAW